MHREKTCPSTHTHTHDLCSTVSFLAFVKGGGKKKSLFCRNGVFLSPPFHVLLCRRMWFCACLIIATRCAQLDRGHYTPLFFQLRPKQSCCKKRAREEIRRRGSLAVCTGRETDNNKLPFSLLVEIDILFLRFVSRSPSSIHCDRSGDTTWYHQIPLQGMHTIFFLRWHYRPSFLSPLFLWVDE